MKDSENPEVRPEGQGGRRFSNGPESERTRVVPVPSRTSGAVRRDRAYLIVLSGSNVGHMFRIEDEVIIGRATEATVRIPDDNVSRRHARLFRDGDHLEIEDLGSANGTLVNGRLIERAVLKDGDKVQVGSTTVLKFTYNDELDEQFQKNMYDAAQRDGLTSAYNKRYFVERLTTEIAFARRQQAPLSLVMVDLDHFKKINDRYGHLAGDAVLVSMTNIVLATIREEDVFARYGGEEFALLLRGIDGEGAIHMAERLRKSIEAGSYEWDEQRIPVTASLGVALFDPSCMTGGDDLIAAADGALYEAKRGGRNRVVILSER